MTRRPSGVPFWAWRRRASSRSSPLDLWPPLLLEIVNQLCTTAGSTVGTGEVSVGRALATLPSASTPGFGLFVLAVLVVVGGVLLWCELVIRAVVLDAADRPGAGRRCRLAAIPAMRRVGWRLAETFLAVALSKFLIVVTLALGLSELPASGATTVITGAVTLDAGLGDPLRHPATHSARRARRPCTVSRDYVNAPPGRWRAHPVRRRAWRWPRWRRRWRHRRRPNDPRTGAFPCGNRAPTSRCRTTTDRRRPRPWVSHVLRARSRGLLQRRRGSSGRVAL